MDHNNQKAPIYQGSAQIRSLAVRSLEALGLKAPVRKALARFRDKSEDPRDKREDGLNRYSMAHKSHSERNNFILARLPLAPAWVLDVGSNTGETSSFIASKGYYVLGCEISEREARRAALEAAPHAAFMNTKLDKNFLDTTPQWDCVLLLSVMHRIYAFDGRHQMVNALKMLSRKTSLIFVEGSTRHARYTDAGQPPPDFSDMEVSDCDRWHREIFSSTLGEAWVVKDSIILEQNQLEPFRITYQLTKR